MEMGEMKYPQNNFSWDDCSNEAKSTFDKLVQEGHSGQDIAFIGTQLLNYGIYMIHRQAEEYVQKKDPWVYPKDAEVLNRDIPTQ